MPPQENITKKSLSQERDIYFTASYFFTGSVKSRQTALPEEKMQN
jgi:hypothetical protein